ncbi:MAG: MFS transporter [Firmicutes bacterium]|nr:MFS transporter [Bacillota bacterium]
MNDDLRLGYSEEQYRKFRRGAWRCLMMFSLLYMSLYCCRLNLGNAAGAMMEGMGWTSKDIGILTSALFWAYGIGQLVNGRLSELAGPVRFITFAALLSPACNLLMSFQKSIAVMAVIWAFNGFFQSMAWGPGLALLSRWWPGKNHGFATGFANAFSGLGQALSMVIAAAALKLMPSLGWRGCFILPAAVPAAILLVFRLLVKESPSDAGLPDFKAEDPEAAENEERMRQLVREKGKLYPYLYMLKNRRFDAWLTIIFITGVTRYGMITWIPLYFSERFGVDITAGLMQSLAFPVGMAIGTFVLPVLTDRFCPNDRLPAVIGCGCLLFASISAFIFMDPTAAGGSAAVSAVLFLAGFAVYAINGCAFSYACDMGGRVFTATASGILDFSAYMGAAAQSVVYGFFLKSMGWSMVFASIAAMTLLIIAIAAAGRKR